MHLFGSEKRYLGTLCWSQVRRVHSTIDEVSSLLQGPHIVPGYKPPVVPWCLTFNQSINFRLSDYLLHGMNMEM